MPISPAIAAAQQKLLMSTIKFDAPTQGLAQPTASPHMELLKTRMGEQGFQRMHERNLRVKDTFERGAAPGETPEQRLSQLMGGGGRYAQLKVRQDVMSNNYNPANHTVSMVDPARIPYAGHELRHAYDHSHKKMDLTIPEHRLQSELNAFGSQQKIADELGVPSGLERSPLEQARTYHGKPGYPGTVDSSAVAVNTWRQAQ